MSSCTCCMIMCKCEMLKFKEMNQHIKFMKLEMRVVFFSIMRRRSILVTILITVTR